MSTTRNTFVPPTPGSAAHRAEARHRTASVRAYRRRTRLYPILTRIVIVAIIVVGVSLTAAYAPGRIGAHSPDSSTVQVFDMSDRAQTLER